MDHYLNSVEAVAVTFHVFIWARRTVVSLVRRFLRVCNQSYELLVWAMQCCGPPNWTCFEHCLAPSNTTPAMRDRDLVQAGFVLTYEHLGMQHATKGLEIPPTAILLKLQADIVFVGASGEHH